MPLTTNRLPIHCCLLVLTSEDDHRALSPGVDHLAGFSLQDERGVDELANIIEREIYRVRMQQLEKCCHF